MKRRTKRNLREQARNMVWPYMGWRRTGVYYWYRTFREGDSTLKITSGLATGIALSFSPLLGTQLFQGIFVNWLLRGSFVAMVIGTLFNNPLTVYPILLADYHMGMFLLDLFGYEGGTVMDAELDEHLSLHALLDHPGRIWLPLMIGGYVIAFFAWFVTLFAAYYPVQWAGRLYRRHRLRRATERGRDL